MRRVSLCVLALAMALGSAMSFSPAQPAAAISSSQYCVEPEEAAFLGLINQYRAQNGLDALVLSQTVGAAAEHHSIDMATNNYFSHILANGEKWSTNMKNHGYTYNTYRGENIAAGNADAYSTFIQWQNSPGHNANMLNPNYRVIGIGRFFNASSTYGYYWTTNFGGYVDGGAAYCGQGAPVAQQQPTAAPQVVPQQVTSGNTGGGTRSLRGSGAAAPAPSQPQPQPQLQPTPRPADGGNRSIRR